MNRPTGLDRSPRLTIGTKTIPKKQTFRGVKRVKVATGEVYFYHRATKIRLPGDYGSLEFVEAWLAAEKKGVASAKPIDDRESYGGLWSAFEASTAWEALKPRTREDYLKVRDYMFERGHRSKRASQMEQRHAEKEYDKALAKGNRFALYLIQVNRRLYNWVLERAARQKVWGDRNPWAHVKPAKGSTRSFKPWKPADVAEALTRAPMGLARAYVLGLSGFDGSTAYKLTWGEYTNGRFDGDRVKTAVGGVSIVPAMFRPWLDQGDRPSDFIITNHAGDRFNTLNSLQTASSRFLSSLADDQITTPGISFHGLRHTLGKAIAESGGDLRAIQSALQHKTERMALHYSKEADKAAALDRAQDGLSGWFLAKADLPDWQKGGSD